jgi:hypothetical protein
MYLIYQIDAGAYGQGLLTLLSYIITVVKEPCIRLS